MRLVGGVLQPNKPWFRKSLPKSGLFHTCGTIHITNRRRHGSKESSSTSSFLSEPCWAIASKKLEQPERAQVRGDMRWQVLAGGVRGQIGRCMIGREVAPALVGPAGLPVGRDQFGIEPEGTVFAVC